MKYIIFIVLLANLTCASQENCYSFTEKRKFLKLNIGFRVNNFVYFSVAYKEGEAKRPLYYKDFFPNRDGVIFFRRIRPGDNTYFHHPKEHLLVFKKNRAHVKNNAYKDMDGSAQSPKKYKICEAMAIVYEMFAFGTNHNFIGDK